MDVTIYNADRATQLQQYAREHGEFTGGEAAALLGVKPQGIGPVLAALVRSGDLIVNYHGSKRLYAAAEETTEQPPVNPDALTSDFEDTLIRELGEEAEDLRIEHEKIIARQQMIEDERARIDAALAELRNRD
jgi:predicted ArsR family transcriptional regulator